MRRPVAPVANSISILSARVSMSPENESEAVELLMALSAHSTRASASPEPEIGASGSKDDDSNLAQNLPSTSAAEVPQQNSLSTPPMVDAAAAKDVVDASSNRSRPSGTTADDADRGQNLNNPAETMIQLVIMGPPSPSGSWSDGLEGSRDSGASTGKGGDSADESNAAPSPPPAAPLHFMQSFTPGAIVV